MDSKAKNDGFLWGMIRTFSPWYLQVLDVAVVWLVYFGIVVLIARLHPVGAAILAATFIVQIYLHECGHALVYKLNGLKTAIWFIPIGAVAGGITPEEDAKTYEWPNWILGWATLAGVIVNTLLIILGACLRTVPNIYVFIVAVGLIMNGAVSVVMNLLPIWQVDGSVAMHSAFGSLNHAGDKAIVVIMSAFTVGITAVALAFPHIPVEWAIFGGATPTIYIIAWIIFPIMLAIATFSAYSKWKNEPIRAKPMTWAQAFTQEVLFLALFAFSMIALFGI